MTTGRVEHYVPSKFTEEQREEYLLKLDEEEEKTGNKIERLRSLVEEAENVFPGNKPGEEGEEEEESKEYKFAANFIVRTFGDTQKYQVGEEGVETAYSVVMLKSLWWPGAYHIAQEGLWTFFYVGDGIKANQPSFLPLQPENIQDEPEDFDE